MLVSYKEIKEVLKRILKDYIREGRRVSLTMDIWTASNGTSYLGVTIYQCDPSQCIHSRLLGFLAISHSYTGSNIFLALKSLLKDFGLLHYILSITTDSVDPNRIACELLETYLVKRKAQEKGWSQEEDIQEAPEIFTASNSWISCLAHVANRAVQDILVSLKATAPAIKEREELLYS